MAASLTACGGGSQNAQTTASTITGAASTITAPDRAARLAAQTQIEQARVDEEAYFRAHQAYAVSAAALKGADPRLSPKIEVIRGDSGGYEIRVRAADAAGTVYIIRKSGDLTERVDSSGNSW